MALSDAVKQAQQQAASRELRRLREIGKYLKEHDEKWFEKKKHELAVWECTPERFSEEGHKKYLRMKTDIKAAEFRVKTYEKVYTNARKLEKKTSGMGEKYMADNWKALDKVEEWINKNYRKACRWQLEIGDEEKEGCEDGDKQGGHEGAFGENV